MTTKTRCHDLLFGLAVGDALGVPVEFRSRSQIARQPVTDMMGYGTYNLPPGTFSDDSSLAFCLAEALTHPFGLPRIAANFVAWLDQNFWTAHGHVFDVGIATSHAIGRLRRGCPPHTAGGTALTDNGNGSLMRILPLLAHLHDKPAAERFALTQQVSAITHGHVRSVVACFYYLEFARHLALGVDKFAAYETLQRELPPQLAAQAVPTDEIELFGRLLRENIHELPAISIQSSGYVLHTLEASIWCLLTTNTYRAATLKAVNLGEDTDTTGAVTGGLAGLLYGHAAIPATWRQQLARHDDIADLASRLGAATGF